MFNQGNPISIKFRNKYRLFLYIWTWFFHGWPFLLTILYLLSPKWSCTPYKIFIKYCKIFLRMTTLWTLIVMLTNVFVPRINTAKSSGPNSFHTFIEFSKKCCDCPLKAFVTFFEALQIGAKKCRGRFLLVGCHDGSLSRTFENTASRNLVSLSVAGEFHEVIGFGQVFRIMFTKF